MKRLHQITFSLVALGLILVSSGGFFLSFDKQSEFAIELGNEGLHIAQEAAAAVFTLGILAGWCVFNYTRCSAAHLVLN